MAKKHPSLDNIRFSNPKYGMVTNGISSLISENSHQRWKYPILIEALLKLFAPAMTRNEYLGFVVDLIREWSGCQGVGVRVLDREDNILYEACRGFSREFWEHHNWISLERDKCVCTRVVAGKPEIQDLPCLTALGSFYSNDTVSFIEGLSERQRLRFRGGCVNRGYLSVAIVPFRWEGKILGTIHLADEKAGMVPLEMVEQLELVTPVLGEALHRFELEEEQRWNHETQSLINSLLHLSQQGLSLNDLLQRILDLLLSARQFGLESAALFITESDARTLTLQAKSELEGVTGICCESVAFGECYCGRAALNKSIQYVHQADEYDEKECRDWTPHDHCCVPIISGENILGVLNARFQVGFDCHRHQSHVEEFFAAVADVIAGLLIRKQTEEALRESEARFREIFKRAATGILLVDMEGNIVDANPAFLNMLGYSSEEVKGIRVRESIHPDDVAATITLFNQLATGEIGQYRLERRHLRKNGETVWTRAAASLVTSSEGLPLYVISIIEDISQRKELEAQLLRAQKLEAAGKIASQVAHDFNNLLGPLVAYPDLIKRHLHAEHPALPLCDLIQEAAETMAVINEDMMALARRGQFDSQPVDLNELIRQVVAQQVNDHDALHVNLELAEEIPPVSGSPAQLSRVISNLICNALEAMQDKGVLTLRTEKSQGGWLLGVSHHLESGEYVRMDVCDTGPGISLENRDKIFDAFFSTKTGQTKRGAGLGLSIVHAIVQDHQGYVDLQSELGKGTIFSVYLPVCRDDDTQEESSDELPRGTERILVVDDDPIQLKVGKKLLKTLGYQVSTVSSGEDALALLRDNPHDLLILDMVMPDGIDGAETYRRALEMKPGQKVIILSGFAQPERMHDALAKGAGVYLRKPVSLEKLARAVRAELDRVP